MLLLNTYESEFEGEKALDAITGAKRLASERDGTEVIYNLFGEASWGNFYRLDMYNLRELESILSQKKKGCFFDNEKHMQIISVLITVAKQYSLNIPEHWR